MQKSWAIIYGLTILVEYMKFAYLLFSSKNNKNSKIPSFGMFATSSDVGSVLATGKPQDIFLW